MAERGVTLPVRLERSLQAVEAEPEQLCLPGVFAVLDQSLPGLLPAQQLQVVGVVFERLAGVIQQRCWLRLGDLPASLPAWQDAVSEAGPIMPRGFPARFVRQSMVLNLGKFVARPELPGVARGVGSGGAAVDKRRGGAALPDAAVSAGEVREPLIEWVGSDEPQQWIAAIVAYFAQPQAPLGVELVELQRSLQLPLVAVWIGVLLGGFHLEQRADFYDVAAVWVSPLVIANHPFP